MNHPNRSRGRNAPGRNPTPAEVRQLREEMEETREEFGARVYASARTVEAWEIGARRMPGDTWEYLCLQWGFPEVERARMEWLQQPGGKFDRRKQSNQ